MVYTHHFILYTDILLSSCFLERRDSTWRPHRNSLPHSPSFLSLRFQLGWELSESSFVPPYDTDLEWFLTGIRIGIDWVFFRETAVLIPSFLTFQLLLTPEILIFLLKSAGFDLVPQRLDFRYHLVILLPRKILKKNLKIKILCYLARLLGLGFLIIYITVTQRCIRQ